MTKHIFESLRLKYPEEKGWRIVFELANARGFGATRRVDAVAVAIWSIGEGPLRDAGV